MQLPFEGKLLFIGDSITSAARNFDHGGEGLGDDPYGSGYVRQIKALLESGYPENRIRVVNKGVGGHTIRDLADRWQADVLDQQPEWLSIMIGINDVWRQFDAPLMTNRHVYPDEYRATYRDLLNRTRSSLKGLVIASPYVMDANRDDAMRKRMAEYGQISREMAAEFDGVFVDTQAAFDAFLEHWHFARLGWDRIHPNATGYMIITRAWLNAVGFVW
ncbi:MAG: SGNH/GDSL hydrolase family protein [Kiritimatiellia bacterium]